MAEVNFPVDNSVVQVYTEDETPLSEMPAFIEIMVNGELACRFEAMPTEVKDAQGKPCVVIKLLETSNNVGETEQ